MPTRVLLLRHAESADPTVFHGAESDVELSPRGIRQAELVARRLAPLTPTAVVSSAMRRARATAVPIAKACGVEIHVEPELHERRIGVLVGTPTSHADGVWPQTLKRWLAGETDYAPAGAESFDDMRRRVVPVLERIVQRYEGQTVVVVAHGLVCRVLLITLLAEYAITDWGRLGPIHNVAVTELIHDAGWRAERINEVTPEEVE